jgi:hypothetical protein
LKTTTGPQNPSELASEIFSYWDDGIKWGRIEAGWWVKSSLMAMRIQTI